MPGSWRARHDRIPPELAKALFARVQELAQKDPSPVRIARQLSAVYKLSISPGTVRHWLVGDRRPGVTTSIRNVFREEPSPSLSYIIGANKGDGCTLVKSGIVKLEVTDDDFAQAFNSHMATLFSRTKPNKILVRHQANRLPLYVVRYSCRKLVELLRQPMDKLLDLASAFPREFLRGFFDAEGHTDVSAENQFQLRVGLENSDKGLLSRVNQVLRDTYGIDSKINQKRKSGTSMFIRGKKFVKRKTSFSLLINRVQDIEAFASRIGFTILRKQEKLVDALIIVRAHPWKDRPVAWKKLYSKRLGEWTKRTDRIDLLKE